MHMHYKNASQYIYRRDIVPTSIKALLYTGYILGALFSFSDILYGTLLSQPVADPGKRFQTSARTEVVCSNAHFFGSYAHFWSHILLRLGENPQGKSHNRLAQNYSWLLTNSRLALQLVQAKYIGYTTPKRRICTHLSSATVATPRHSQRVCNHGREGYYGCISSEQVSVVYLTYTNVTAADYRKTSPRQFNPRCRLQKEQD